MMAVRWMDVDVNQDWLILASMLCLYLGMTL